jgi:hypothetical protein
MNAVEVLMAALEQLRDNLWRHSGRIEDDTGGYQARSRAWDANFAAAYRARTIGVLDWKL